MSDIPELIVSGAVSTLTLMFVGLFGLLFLGELAPLVSDGVFAGTFWSIAGGFVTAFSLLSAAGTIAFITGLMGSIGGY